MSNYTVIDPYTQKELVTYTLTPKDELDIKLAQLVKGKKAQLKLSPFERSNILKKLSDLLERDKEEISILISKEIGKSIHDSRAEVARARVTFDCSSEEARRIHGEVLHSDSFPPKREKWGIVQKFPIGVVLCITPFNFPINLSAHKIGPAFAAGNTILFKASPQNYLTGKKLTQLCYEAGMTEDMIQFCMPDIPEMNYLVSHPEVSAISFTGGTQTARAIAKNAGIKKLLFELGGNDPLIVMDDADVDDAVAKTVIYRFGCAGQRCTASKRIFVHEKVYDEYKNKLVARAKELKIGNPLDEVNYMGPVVNLQSAKIIEERIQAAVIEGASLLFGGLRENAIIYPTVIENVNPKSALVLDETFGPVVPLFKFKNLNEMIEIANSTEFGLQAGVFTQNLKVIKELYEKIEVGALIVNDGPGFRAEHFPFGGVKTSGLGREGVKYAIEELSIIKTLVM